MDCPEPALLADLIHGEAPSLDAAAVGEHLAKCGQCIDVVAAVVTASWASPEATSEPSGSNGPSDAAGQSVGGSETTRPIVHRGMAIIPPGTCLGRYRVRRWLGRGGMGEVYEGYDPDLDRRVALKLLRTRGTDDASAQQRLRREAKNLARLSSPHVVAALDVGVFGGSLFLVMELVEGPTLASWLSLEPRGWREILDMFLAAGEGLAAAHEVGVIHRDFKPQNVLIGVDGKPRVSDFGLAREADDQTGDDDRPSDMRQSDVIGRSDAPGATAETLLEGSGRPGRTTPSPTDERTALTRTGMALGTPRYMAPEQFLRRPLDARVDQFSFCVALYEALYGEHPFAPQLPKVRQGESTRVLATGDQPESLRTAILCGRTTTAPRRMRIPRTIATALRRGLAHRPDDRYKTFRNLLAELRNANSARRRRTVVAASILLLAIAGSVSTRFRRESTALVPTGQPSDWTASRIIGDFKEWIHCVHKTRPHTLRVIWGRPRRAEDIDIRTGQRTPSALAPETYRDGCPTTSPDGTTTIFEGYDHKDRSHIFMSTDPSGANAERIARSAEPTLNSEPLWLTDNSFVFDFDFFHPAVFSVDTSSSVIVPDSDRRALTTYGFFKAANVSARQFSISESGAQHSWVHLYSSGPSAEREASVLVARDTNGGWTWRFGSGPNVLFGTSLHEDGSQRLVRLDVPSRTLTWAIVVANRDVVDFVAVDSGRAVIVTRALSWEVEYRDASGVYRRVPRSGGDTYRSQSVTRDGDILLTRRTGLNWSLVRYRTKDGAFDHLSTMVGLTGVSALPDGGWLLGVEGFDHPGTILRCPGGSGGSDECRPLVSVPSLFGLVANSPGTRVAFANVGPSGVTVNVLSTTGGKPKELAHRTSQCQLIWSSPTTLWFSRLERGGTRWIEIDVGSGELTGRSAPGSGDCFSGIPDPAPPEPESVRAVVAQDWDLRIGQIR